MRKYINVLWLDDNDANANINSFKSALMEYGYESNVIKVQSIADAIQKMSNKNERIDFFVSDFSLSDENDKNGYNFLIEVRKRGYLKEYFVLYSHVEKRGILESIFGEIAKDKESILYSNNFSFISTGGLSKTDKKTEFKKSINSALIRWNELSALRGEYASLNTLLESITRKILSIILGNENQINALSYYECINKLKDNIDSNIVYLNSTSNYDDIFKDWDECRMDRNALEHNPEKWDSNRNDFYIFDPKRNKTIYEQDLYIYRNKIIKTLSNVTGLFDDLINSNCNLNSLRCDEDFNCLLADC